MLSDFYITLHPIPLATILPVDLTPLHPPLKVISAIIVEHDGQYIVGSLATGTKCIDGAQLNFNGDRVTDSHAEVLACRAFKSLIYDDLDTYFKNGLVYLHSKFLS